MSQTSSSCGAMFQSPISAICALGSLGEPAGAPCRAARPASRACRAVRIVERAAVGDVQAPDPDAAAGGADGAGLLDGVLAACRSRAGPGSRRSTSSRPDPGGDGDAVPLVDAEVRHLVAHALEELPRELLVLALGLLDGQDVAVGALQPGLHPVGTGTERVHIPGRNLHSPNLPNLDAAAPRRIPRPETGHRRGHAGSAPGPFASKCPTTAAAAAAANTA